MAIQRKGIEVKGAMALQSVEAPGPVCQQTATSKKKHCYKKSSRCCLKACLKPLLHPNSVESWSQGTINSSYYAATEM